MSATQKHENGHPFTDPSLDPTFSRDQGGRDVDRGRTNTIALFFSSRLRYLYMSDLVERIQAALLARHSAP